jgi:lysine-ketoglutarate reductase/saccharopine dehydrogenase-like protein (TIGR00300 family)
MEHNVTKRFVSDGHLIDSGILPDILNIIIEEGAEYHISDFRIGQTNLETSHIEFDLVCQDEEQLSDLTKKLLRIGCYEKSVTESQIKEAPKDGAAPDDFYSTTNHRTEIFLEGRWRKVAKQRMDGAIVITPEGPEVRLLREIRQGDKVLCSAQSVRVFPTERDRKTDIFGFMNGDVSSERSVDIAVAQIAEDWVEVKKRGGKVIVVAGPVVVHTGGATALSILIREGFVQGLLAGNALAVHDIESVLYGTSLGVDLKSGRPTHEGHRNHLRAINRVRTYGSIAAAIEAGALDRGVMYETITHGVPFSLAGSIRDDGPLPETEMDMVAAQRRYAEIVQGASMVLMLSSMLHSIGTGNMLPSWVRTVCVDINPAVVTKLADRGSSQALGIVSDVGFFLRALCARLVPSLTHV